MRLAAILALPLLLNFAATAATAQSSNCKQCQDQQKRCMANYPGPTCKTEYDICLKGCRTK